MPQPVSAMLIQASPFSAPVAIVMLPRFSIAWPALISRFISTWLISEGRHSTSGNSP